MITNSRDSGLTDSGFIAAQRMVQGRHKQISEEYENNIKTAREKILKERFASKATPKKSSLWDMIMGLFK